MKLYSPSEKFHVIGEEKYKVCVDNIHPAAKEYNILVNSNWYMSEVPSTFIKHLLTFIKVIFFAPITITWWTLKVEE